MTNFNGPAYTSATVTATRTPFAAASTVVLQVEGTYELGFCIRNPSVTLNNNEYVTGWCMVTN